MFVVLRQRNFALYWIASLISLLGDWVLFAALPYYIYKSTGSTLATGSLFIASTVPRIVIGPIAGIFVDRWDRKQILIAADLSRALLLLLLLTAPTLGWFWMIYWEESGWKACV